MEGVALALPVDRKGVRATHPTIDVCLHAELGKVQMFYGVEQGDSYAWEDSELTHLKTCTQHSPFCERYCSLRSYARLSSPALFRAEARASRVGQGWFEGAHFNHRLSISLK